MFILESHWIYKQAKTFAPRARTIIDIGSDSKDYRNNIQPYIADLYQRFADNGITIATLDSDSTKHPDILQDICLPLSTNNKYDIVLAANVIEHVELEKLQRAIQNLFNLAGSEGIVIITVPYNLPLHKRPIDNMLRPTSQELKDFVAQKCLLAEQWEDKHYREPYISDQSLAPLPIVTGAVFHHSKSLQ